MRAKPSERVTKTECCRRFGWTRYQFDLNVTAGMPVVEAAGHRGAEWRIDPAAVRRWLAERAAEQAARRRRAAAYHEECRREAERVVVAKWEREQARERARRYSWDAVTDQYEALLKRVCEMSGPGSLPDELRDAPAPTVAAA